MKVTALGALVALLLALCSWGGSNIFSNSKDISVLKERSYNQKEAIDRIDQNVQIIRRHLISGSK